MLSLVTSAAIVQLDECQTATEKASQVQDLRCILLLPCGFAASAQE